MLFISLKTGHINEFHWKPPENLDYTLSYQTTGVCVIGYKSGGVGNVYHALRFKQGDHVSFTFGL